MQDSFLHTTAMVRALAKLQPEHPALPQILANAELVDKARRDLQRSAQKRSAARFRFASLALRAVFLQRSMRSPAIHILQGTADSVLAMEHKHKLQPSLVLISSQ